MWERDGLPVLSPERRFQWILRFGSTDLLQGWGWQDDPAPELGNHQHSACQGPYYAKENPLKTRWVKSANWYNLLLRIFFTDFCGFSATFGSGTPVWSWSSEPNLCSSNRCHGTGGNGAGTVQEGISRI